MSISLNDREIAVLNSILESKRTKEDLPLLERYAKQLDLSPVLQYIHIYLV